MSAAFPLFPRLPPELRDEIWHAALPHTVRPALIPYRVGWWQPRWLSPLEPGFDSENPENNIALEVCHNAVDQTRVPMALALANARARDIAIAWAQKPSSPVSCSQEGGRLVFFHTFDPDRDIIYVPIHQWGRFVIEPHNRMYQTDLLGHVVDIRPGLARIAVSADLLRKVRNSVSELFDHYYSVRKLYIVMNVPERINRRFTEYPEQRLLCELKHSKRVAVWADKNWEISYAGEDELLDDETRDIGENELDHSQVRKLLELVTSGLREGLLSMYVESFEIHICTTAK
ncbi:hypothetical protein F4777DRAFT_570906 [Nemania sp. FL0916]|nr:hypothetical protein F4777DRAFT_570906 [Nemania sp. FL0916]